MRSVAVGETVWPVDDEDDSVQWRLRYGIEALVLEVRMQAASICAAYAALIDPNLSQTDAIGKLKLARRAAVPSPEPSAAKGNET